jgi:hypothetical protein
MLDDIQRHGCRRMGCMQHDWQVEANRRSYQRVQEGFSLTRLGCGHALIEQSIMWQADFPHGYNVTAMVFNLFQHRFHLRPRRVETLRMQAKSSPYLLRKLFVQVENPLVRLLSHTGSHHLCHTCLSTLLTHHIRIWISLGIKMTMDINEHDMHLFLWTQKR